VIGETGSELCDVAEATEAEGKGEAAGNLPIDSVSKDAIFQLTSMLFLPYFPSIPWPQIS
jgi:hypothetical protein